VKGIKLIFLFLKIYFYRNHNKKSKNIIKIVKDTKKKKNEEQNKFRLLGTKQLRRKR
jgi:hypothetical protein